MVASLVALRYVAFGFLTAPLAYSFWFFSMDVAEWIFGELLSRNQRCWISVLVGLIALGVRLRRTVFIVFGVLGIHVYLGHLAYEVFKDSVLFPFALALLGLSVILVTVLAQRQLSKRLRPRVDESDFLSQ